MKHLPSIGALLLLLDYTNKQFCDTSFLCYIDLHCTVFFFF